MVRDVSGIEKSMIFRSIFHAFFMFLPKPLPEAIFGGPKRRSSLNSAVPEPFWDSGGSQNGAQNLTFPQKCRQKTPMLLQKTVLGPTFFQGRFPERFGTPFWSLPVVILVILGAIFGHFGDFVSHFRHVRRAPFFWGGGVRPLAAFN